MNDIIQPDLKSTLKRLKLGPLLNTLPERLALARQQKLPHQDFLLMVLRDEVERRDSNAATRRAKKAGLDPHMQLDCWDPSAKVQYDQELLNELVSLRFIAAGQHIAMVGPVGVGKTFLAHAIGHIACRRRYSVVVTSADRMLKSLRHARLDHTFEAEMRRLLAVDLLIIDDFGLDAMDANGSRDIHELMVDRHRNASVIITSNRGPDEWLATFADPVRAQAAIDRFVNNAYDFVIEGESYRTRQKPRLSRNRRPGQTEVD